LEKNRNNILGFYAALSLIVILCCLPNFDLQNFGYLLSLIVLIAAYICRRRWPRNESFEENHTTFIIRSLWLYNTFAAFGMIGAAIIIAQNGNMDSVNALAETMMTGEVLSDAQLDASMQQYVSDNEALLKQQFLLWLSPAQIYLVWRILRGGERAFKNYRIANPKNWF
jgi:uncharacterized membrane protein